VTKPPNWHGLVAWDLLFNNMTTGLYLTAAVADLARPGLLGPVARWAYPLALVLLTADLVCLVLDLGDPKRFHHMLRVFKPSSPMSLGTWSLTAYSLPLTAIVAIDLVSSGGGALGVIRTIAVVAGLLPALGSAVYKGVLFSTTSQPAWRDGRWLGAYLVGSALMLGSAELLAIAAVMDGCPAMGPLRVAFAVLLALSLVSSGLLAREFLPTLRAIEGRRDLIRDGLIAAGLGVVAPLVLMLAGPRVLVIAGLACLLGANYLIRRAIVLIPHKVSP
jgi:hypothetical protein